jgi:spermidine synthase
MQHCGFNTLPYHCLVPSFGEWGFILASPSGQWKQPEQFTQGLKFMTPEGFAAMRYFPPDMGMRPTEINRLNNQALVTYFEKEWGE